MGKRLIEQRRLTLMLTYRCNAQCKDCGTFSSPHDQNDISLETALSSLENAQQCGMSQVVFTGGEATLRWDDLVSSVSYARKLGMKSRLVTNAQWATTPEEAERRFKILRDAGLDEINYSTGDEHVRFVPIDNIINAVAASVNAEMTTALMFELRANPVVDEKDLLARIEACAPPEKLKKYFTFLRSPWMPIKPMNKEEYPDGLYANLKNVAFRGGCDSALGDYVVQGTGKIAACCGLGMRAIPELQLGDAVKDAETSDNPLADAVKEGENDLFLYAVRKIGPEKILAWAAQKDPSIKWENMYAHRCQACMRIYRDPRVKEVIAEHMEELIADMVYGGYVLRKFEQMADQAASPTASDNVTHYV